MLCEWFNKRGFTLVFDVLLLKGRISTLQADSLQVRSSKRGSTVPGSMNPATHEYQGLR